MINYLKLNRRQRRSNTAATVINNKTVI